MPLGTVLFSFDLPQSGEGEGKCITHCSYPKTFKISRGLQHKISQFFLKSGNKQDEVLELQYGDKIILIYSKKIDHSDSFEILAIILSSDEIPNKNKFKELILNNINNFYKQDKQDRYLNFESFGGLFFDKNTSKKLLFIGFPSAGKTSIKKTFFDKEDPNSILGDEAPEPTRGLVHFIYSWFNAEVGIVDSSGQEFESYVSMGNDVERVMAFEGSDIVIYVFDVSNWKDEEEKVISNLEKIISTKNEIAPNSKIYAFCHKIDLLSSDDKNNILKVKEILEKSLGIKTTFSSIQPEYIHTLFRSMELILNETKKLI
ncbi:MAG: GTPase [Promethearchaeota archaeon]